MAKANYIKLTLVSLILVLVMCEVSVASPTFSFSGFSRRSDSAGLSQASYKGRSFQLGLQRAIIQYQSVIQQAPACNFVSAENEGTSLTSFRRGYSPVPLVRGWKTDPQISNFQSSSSKRNWSNWASWRRRHDSSTGWSGYKPSYSDLGQHGNPIDLPTTFVVDPSTISPPNATVVPTPAAISLGCFGLFIVGWLHNRKAA